MTAPAAHINDLVFTGDVIKIGRWRLPATHPRFRDSGPTRHYLVVFPRTSLWIQHAGGEAFPSDATNVTYYNVHQEYRRTAISPAGDHCDYYAIDPTFLRQAVGAWDPRLADAERRILPFAYGPCDAAAYYTQRSVYRHVRTQAVPDPLFVEETMAGVLERLLGLAFRAPVRGRDRHRDLVEATRECIARDFRSPTTVAAVAAAVGASAFHLCRVFRAGTGQTIHAYRNELRLRAALAPVLGSRADLSELALDLGYSSHSHFTAAFRRHYGVTPSAARRGQAVSWCRVPAVP